MGKKYRSAFCPYSPDTRKNPSSTHRAMAIISRAKKRFDTRLNGALASRPAANSTTDIKEMLTCIQLGDNGQPQKCTRPPLPGFANIRPRFRIVLLHQPASQPMLPLLGLHHVVVICADYAASKRFHTEIPGLKILAETYRAARNSYKLD